MFISLLSDRSDNKNHKDPLRSNKPPIKPSKAPTWPFQVLFSKTSNVVAQYS